MRESGGRSIPAMAIFPGKLECNLITAVAAPHHLWRAPKESLPNGRAAPSFRLASQKPNRCRSIVCNWQGCCKRCWSEVNFGFVLSREPLARHGIQTWATRPSDSEPAAGESTCYFPIPTRLILSGVGKSLSLIVISPVSEPLLCGWNCTAITQLFSIVSFLLQLLCSMKSPVTVKLDSDRFPFPTFASATLMGVLVFPPMTDPKLIDRGNTA